MQLTLGPSSLVEAEANTGIVQRLADQISALGWNVVVLFAENHDKLALDVTSTLQTVVALAGAQRVAVDVGSEVADCSTDARVQGAAVGQVAT